MSAILTLHNLECAFRMALERHQKTPHQSKGVNVSRPGITLAAKDLGVSRTHLHRVLTGERQSPMLISRWKAWLRSHPSFANLQPRA
jgi:hypothetical protein